MKQIFTLLLAIVASVGTMFAEIYSGTCGNYYNGWKVESNTVTWSLNTEDSTLVIDGYGEMEDWNLENPGLMQGEQITAPWGYEKAPLVAHVVIGKDISRIGEFSFSTCNNIVSIIVDSQNTVLDSRDGCNAVIETQTNKLVAGCKGTIIPNTVTTIGTYAFCYCSELMSIDVPNSVTTIEYWAFANVLNVNYSGTATGAPWGARSYNGVIDGYFAYSDNTKKHLNACLYTAKGDVVIPNGVVCIGEKAFYDCIQITSIDIPNTVTSIGTSAFSGCDRLSSLTIPEQVRTVGANIISSMYAYHFSVIWNGNYTFSVF